jgi:glycogen synthase
MSAMWSNTLGRSPAVLMTVDAVGGVWPYAIRLCAALPETRFVVATMGPRARQPQRDEIDVLENVTLVESEYCLEWMAGGIDDFAASRDWIVNLVETYGIDLLHLNGYAHACLGADFPVLVVAHSDVLSWWAATHNCAAPPEWDAYRKRVATGLGRATRVVAPSAAVLADLKCYYRLSNGKTTVIPNGIDLAAISPLLKRRVVLAAGRLWDAAKNLAALDAIAPDIAWPVEIAGDIEHPESGAVNFSHTRLLGSLGHVEMAQYLGRASIFVAPARYEPFGLAILEAAAAGCALVLGDISSLRENWDGAAVFVDPDDRSALKSAINQLIANPDKRNRAAAAARYRAREFMLTRMARAYAAVYRQMVRSSVLVDST